MLEVVKSYIKSLPDISFDQYFIQYMMEVQDMDLSLEVDRKFKCFEPNIHHIDDIDSIINKTYERLLNDEKNR